MYYLNETGMRSEQRLRALRDSEDERADRRPSAARPEGRSGTERSGSRLRVVPAPGGFAFVED